MGPRLFIILGVVLLALIVFSLVDVIMTDKQRVRALNKPLWLLIVLIPLIGALLWFFLGKERRSGSGEPRPLAPDDDPGFLRTIRRDEEQDERIRRLEQELAELDDDPPKD
jgi:hypothetical protein